jgi:hypothetical protein
MRDWETAAGSCSTMTVREGTTTVTALTPSIGASSRSTRATSAEQHTPSTSRYVFSHFPLLLPPPPSTSPIPGAASGSSLSSSSAASGAPAGLPAPPIIAGAHLRSPGRRTGRNRRTGQQEQRELTARLEVNDDRAEVVIPEVEPGVCEEHATGPRQRQR